MNTSQAHIAPNQTTRTKLSFGKAFLLMSGICVVYAMLIPVRVLSDNPGILPFVNIMESLLPAIRGFAKKSPIPEVVRFYYATMWLAFPPLYLTLRLRWMAPLTDKPILPGKKLLGVAGIFLSVVAIFVYLFILGFYEVKDVPLKNIATGGRGNALFIALSFHSISIGLSSCLVWNSIAIFVEILMHSWKHIAYSGPA